MQHSEECSKTLKRIWQKDVAEAHLLTRLTLWCAWWARWALEWSLEGKKSSAETGRINLTKKQKMKNQKRKTQSPTQNQKRHIRKNATDSVSKRSKNKRNIPTHGVKAYRRASKKLMRPSIMTSLNNTIKASAFCQNWNGKFGGWLKQINRKKIVDGIQ